MQGIIHKKSLKGSYHSRSSSYLQKTKVNNKSVTKGKIMLFKEENQEQDILYKRHETKVKHIKFGEHQGKILLYVHCTRQQDSYRSVYEFSLQIIKCRQILKKFFFNGIRIRRKNDRKEIEYMYSVGDLYKSWWMT
jgi:hypothetical protein